MNSRISQATLFKQHPQLVNHLIAIGELPADSVISNTLRHLVRLRASQINGCGFCQHMHTNEARQDGEQQERLDVLPAWREMVCFSEVERAALAWTEALTQISDGAIDDALYQQTLNTFGEAGLIALTAIIVQINSWNRIAVSFQFQPDFASK